MKKHIIYILALLGGVIGLASCNQNLLDIEQKSVIDQDSYYANATDDDALSLIASIYRYYYDNLYSAGAPSGGNFPIQIKNCLGGDTYHASDAAVEIQEFSNHIEGPTSICVKPLYQHHYAVIKYCNLILEKLADDTPTKKLVRAEAQAMRGIIYVDLIRYWGTPPLVDHILTPAEASEVTNSDPKELWEFCESDLLAAAAALPSKSGLNGQASIGGRLTREACYGYLAKAKMWQKDYSGAADYLGKVISSGLYDLIDNVEDLYHPAADFSSEYIFEHNANDSNDANRTNQDSRTKVVFLGWRADAIHVPTFMIDGTWGYLSVSKEFGDFLYSYDRDAEGNLTRRAKTLAISFDDLMTSGWNFNGLLDADGNYRAPEKGSDLIFLPPVKFCGGYFQIRMTTYTDDLFSYTSSFNAYNKRNIPYMRYSEILLMYAEALLNTSATCNMTGLQALNKVRERAGMPALDSYSLNDIKNERRAEMFFECERFLDLVRWGDAATVLKDKGKKELNFYGYVNDGGVGSEWDIREVDGLNPNGFTAGKNELLPFPQSEIIATKIQQNPGY